MVEIVAEWTYIGAGGVIYGTTEHAEKEYRAEVEKKKKQKLGRKLGFRMADWQKQLQIEAIRHKELESFNLFLNKFTECFFKYENETFLYIIFDERYNHQKTFFLSQIKKDQILCRSIFYFKEEGNPRNLLCLKAYDLYEGFIDSTFVPEDETVCIALATLCKTYIQNNARIPNRQIYLEKFDILLKKSCQNAC